MPQICSICRHEKRQEIDQALLSQQPFRTVADHWSVSKTALIRHRKDHLAVKLAMAPGAAADLAMISSETAKAKEAAEVDEAETLYGQLRSIGRDTRAILEKAKTENNHELALKAIARCEKQLELLARLLGELDDGVKLALGVQVNATQSNKPDLSKLSPAELDQLESLISKAQSASAIQITGKVVR